jgi:hypothetical protein
MTSGLVLNSYICLLNKHFHFSEAILSKYLNFKHWASLSCYSDRGPDGGIISCCLSLKLFQYSGNVDLYSSVCA